jgi:low molecular weight protein-tyrosine phosphatase
VHSVQRLFDRALNRALRLLARPAATTGAPAASTRILFVCFGNVCRSPLAEAILRAKLERDGLADLVAVDSAGTSAFNVGRPPDWRARWCARQHGLTIGNQRARQLDAADFDRFDQIVVMDGLVAGEVASRALTAAHRQRVTPIAVYADGVEVPDPVEGTLSDFRRTYSVIDAACEELVLELRARLRPPAAAPA